jgi:hypothetical protein
MPGRDRAVSDLPQDSASRLAVLLVGHQFVRVRLVELAQAFRGGQGVAPPHRLCGAFWHRVPEFADAPTLDGTAVSPAGGV